MAIPINEYPYTDLHEMNMDWVLKQIQQLVEAWAETETEWHNTQDEWTALYNYVHDYFDNLDVTQEVQNAIDQMIIDGTLQPIIAAVVAQVYDAVPTQNSTLPVQSGGVWQADKDLDDKKVDRSGDVMTGDLHMSPLAGYGRVYLSGPDGGDLIFVNNLGFVTQVKSDNVTLSGELQLPEGNGTIALRSDRPTSHFTELEEYAGSDVNAFISNMSTVFLGDDKDIFFGRVTWTNMRTYFVIMYRLSPTLIIGIMMSYSDNSGNYAFQYSNGVITKSLI